MSRVAAAVLLLVFAAGCSRESEQLQVHVDRLRVERDELVEIAENLDEYRANEETLARDLERARALGLDQRHEQRRAAAAKVPGVTFANVGQGWRISGSDRRSLEAVFDATPALHVQRLAVEKDGSWTVESPIYDPQDYELDMANAAVATPTPEPLPTPRRFSTPRARRLRAEAERLQVEVAELRELVGPEAASWEARNEQRKRMLGLAERPNRLRQARWIHDTLMGAATSPCRHGGVELAQPAIRFHCAPRSSDAHAAVEQVKAAFRDSLADHRLRLGPFSIDSDREASVSGVLLPVSP